MRGTARDQINGGEEFRCAGHNLEGLVGSHAFVIEHIKNLLAESVEEFWRTVEGGPAGFDSEPSPHWVITCLCRSADRRQYPSATKVSDTRFE